jgi:hypothetical protein
MFLESSVSLLYCTSKLLEENILNGSKILFSIRSLKIVLLIFISKQFNFDRRQLKNTQLIVLMKTFTHFFNVKEQARSTIFF